MKILTRHTVLPGFNLTLGISVLYLSLIVLIPLSATFLKSASLGWDTFWTTVTSPRVLASYRLTFGASLAAACINLVFGLLAAWVLVRYRFRGRGLM
ncbi:MAG: sulfate ABC transporter permease subunit CysT, partial [Methylococcales bacterium]